jgi:hypothetical protein
MTGECQYHETHEVHHQQGAPPDMGLARYKDWNTDLVFPVRPGQGTVAAKPVASICEAVEELEARFH